MKNEKIEDLYIKWKGLKFLHSMKFLSYWFVTILSIVFLFISIVIQNYWIFGISIILLFLQRQNNPKDLYTKYKSLYDEVKKHKKITKSNREWIDFLDKVDGLNGIHEWFFKKIYRTLKKKK